MKINLYVGYYVDANPIRRGEINTCLLKNLSAGFDKVVVIADELYPILRHSKIIHEPSSSFSNNGLPCRPTFNDFFKIGYDLGSYCINVYSNSDIYFTPESVEQIRGYMQAESSRDVALALSRWENGALYDHADSQDTWVMQGATKRPLPHDFCMGIAGCDNRLAYELDQMGYTVLNPSKTIQTHHLHVSGVRNYIGDNGAVKETVPPPYLLVTPDFLAIH